MGYTPVTKYLVLLVVAIQVTTALLLRDTHPLSWRFVLASYVIGGTANQNLFLAIHEITHNLAFKSVMANRLLAMTANLGIGVPYSVVFKVRLCEIMIHGARELTQTHRSRMSRSTTSNTTSGWERTWSIPTCRASLRPCVSTTSQERPSSRQSIYPRLINVRIYVSLTCRILSSPSHPSIFQILFYALRPGFIRSQGAFTRYHALNFAVVLSFNFALVKGTGSWSPLVYLLMSSFMAGSLHPLAGHFIGQSRLSS